MMLDSEIRKELLVYRRDLEAVEFEGTPLLPSIMQHSEVKQAARYLVQYDSNNDFKAEFAYFAGEILTCPEYQKLHRLMLSAHFTLLDYVALEDGKPVSKLDNLTHANNSVLKNLSKAWGISEEDVAAQIAERKEIHDRLNK